MFFQKFQPAKRRHSLNDALYLIMGAQEIVQRFHRTQKTEMTTNEAVLLKKIDEAAFSTIAQVLQAKGFGSSNEVEE